MKILFSVLSLILLSAYCVAQEKVYDIITYGAVGDNKTVATKSIQVAIDACNANGGGKVIIPTGVFIIGTVHLKTNVHLYLQSGAILRGSKNLDDYEIFVPDKPFSNVHKGMLFTEDAENVTISGEGQIDGNGDEFFDLTSAKKISAEGTKLTRQKDNFRKVTSGIGDGPIVPKDRPYQMFVFSNCKRVTVKDIFVTKAPFWCMHFADCDAVNVTGIRLWNSMLAPNADGIDITSCTNVTVSNCDIRAGDDAIAIVGYDHHFEIPGYKRLRHISENILVTNCNLQSYSSGIRIGFLDQNSVRNIQVSNVNITNSSRGIGIFLRDMGSLENISFANMYIETKLHTGDWWGNGEPIHISAIRGLENVKLGKIKNISFRDIVCKGENGLILYGSAESIIEDVRFNNVSFELTDSKLNDVGGGNVDLRGAMRPEEQLFARDIPGMLLQYVKNVTINDFKLVWTNTRMPYFTHGIEANNFSNINIRNFSGTASPINSKASRVHLTNGTGFLIDNKMGLVTAIKN